MCRNCLSDFSEIPCMSSCTARYWRSVSFMNIGSLTVIFHLMACINFYQYSVHLFACSGENQYSEAVFYFRVQMTICPYLLHISCGFRKFGFSQQISEKNCGSLKNRCSESSSLRWGRKWISLRTFHIHPPIWAKFVIRSTHIYLFGFVCFENEGSVEAVLL